MQLYICVNESEAPEAFEHSFNHAQLARCKRQVIGAKHPEEALAIYRTTLHNQPTPLKECTRLQVYSLPDLKVVASETVDFHRLHTHAYLCENHQNPTPQKVTAESPNEALVYYTHLMKNFPHKAGQVKPGARTVVNMKVRDADSGREVTNGAIDFAPTGTEAITQALRDAHTNTRIDWTHEIDHFEVCADDWTTDTTRSDILSHVCESYEQWIEQRINQYGNASVRRITPDMRQDLIQRHVDYWQHCVEQLRIANHALSSAIILLECEQAHTRKNTGYDAATLRTVESHILKATETLETLSDTPATYDFLIRWANDEISNDEMPIHTRKMTVEQPGPRRLEADLMIR